MTAEEDLEASLVEVLQENYGEALVCVRDWSAWGHGTMSSEDFQSAFEQDGVTQDAIQSLKKIVDDLISEARRAEREGLLDNIVAISPMHFASVIRRPSDMIEGVGYAMKMMLGDDWAELQARIEAKLAE